MNDKEKDLICSFCSKKFVRESAYLKHKCKYMVRYELFNTVIGHLAYMTFNQWRKISNLPPTDVEKFVNSKYFPSFERFAKFCKHQSIPDKIGYIELMVEKKLPPFMWTDVDVYDFYLENFDKNYTIEKKVDITSETIKNICSKIECDTKDFFDYVEPINLLKMITSRKLSPWVLLLSQKFLDFMKYKADKETKLLFNTFIDTLKWKKLFSQNPEKIVYIKSVIKELKL